MEDPIDYTYRLFSGPFFRLAYPRDWEMEIIEDIPAFYDADGAGALQVVASRKESGDYEPQEELERWLVRQGVEVAEDRITVYEGQPGVLCAACEFVRDDRFWMVQVMTAGTALLVVIYNADEVPDAETVGILSLIIRSITIVEEVN